MLFKNLCSRCVVFRSDCIIQAADKCMILNFTAVNRAVADGVPDGS